jgi:RNA polymerase sigma-70 factor (ECF subfamily)
MEPTQTGTLAVDWQSAWREHAGWLRTVLRARVRDDLTADELLHEVRVTAWRQHEQLCDHNRVGPWLYRIAIRQVLMFWRSHNRNEARVVRLETAAATEDFSDQRQINPLDWMTTREAHQKVRDALGTLPPQDREILMLKHAEQWTYAEIARHLGLSSDKVIYRLERARGRLRIRLLAIDSNWNLP